MHPVDADGERVPYQVPPRVPVARDLANILSVMRSMMVEVVEGEKGTGRQARTEGLRVAGKTGTAQNPHGEDHALFASFAPAETPQVALVVVLERRGHGGAEAAPIAGAFWRAYQALRSRDAANPTAKDEEVVG
jgi:cell division protein FtsI/penicillin-binding protein 2